MSNAMRLPRFEELTPERVNDLIAERVMGWRRDERFSLSWYSGETPQKIRFYENMLLDWASDDQPDSSDIFDPYSDLNDCHDFEGKLTDYELRKKYIRGFSSGASNPNVIYFGLLHATAKQKCRAILTALNLCE